MPINRLALIRYKTIDNCLQNRYRKWTLEDLMEAVSDALYEYEGIKQGISKRTIQLDLQNMRSEKLGYNAPIVVTERKYYSYDEPNYSITNTALSKQDLNTLNEVLGVLKQFKGFGYFQELNGMVTRLENKLYKQKHKGVSYIDFEKNELLKGLEFIDPIHKAIVNKTSLLLSYQSFKAAKPTEIVFFPYLLKEYRNRWFVLGSNKKARGIVNLALDRIVSLNELHSELYYENNSVDITTHFNDVIGVTKMPGQKPYTVVLHIDKENAPYIKTKPLHYSQAILKEDASGMIFSIQVIWNFELEREILGFGDKMKVLSPKRLSGTIQARYKNALKKYQRTDEWES